MKNLYFLLAITLFVMLNSCNKDEDLKPDNETDILEYNIIGYSAEVNIDDLNQFILVKFLPEVVSADNLVAQFILSEGASATVDGVTQKSGQTENNFEVPLEYKVTANDGITKKMWDVIGTNNSYSYSWGLGQFVLEEKSNNRSYEWYFDQGTTGEFSSINCGPTSTTMIAKWSDENFTKTPEDARAAYRPEGGWWYTSDIDNYLSDNGIPHNFVSLSTSTESTQQIIKNELDAGNALILCLDMYYVSYGAISEHRIDKFYTTNSTGWGHFIVVKGYKSVDNNFLFEVYDPYSNGMSYKDGTIKGKNRYYRSEDIYSATSIWWNYAITVSKKGTKNKSTQNYIIDISDIPVQIGM